MMNDLLAQPRLPKRSGLARPPPPLLLSVTLPRSTRSMTKSTAFNLVLADEARENASSIDEMVSGGNRPRTPCRSPRWHSRTTCARRASRRRARPRSSVTGSPRTTATVVDALARGRSDCAWQNEPGRVRHGVQHRELCFWADEEPTRHQPCAQAVHREDRPPLSQLDSCRSASDPILAARSGSRLHCAAPLASSRRTAP